ncbi:MAG: amidohydrolase family protein [Rhodobacteraceae bacterium]|nr:amidohydrolase family protein [Paracoccaceae bacterium]
MLIDTHFHIYSADTPLSTDRWGHRKWPAPLADILPAFTKFGVSHGVMTTSSEYGLYNAEFAVALSAHKNLRATTNLALDTTRAQLTALSAQGFLGTRLHWRPLDQTPDPDSPAYQRLFRLCADIGWHMHLTERAARMERTILALERAGMRVVVDHMGFLDTPEGVDDPHFQAILRAIERGQTWATLSGGFRFKNTDPDALATALIGTGGWERLMWASDWPFVGYHGKVSYAQAVSALAHHVTDPAMQAVVGHETAHKFYFSR